MKQIMNDEFKLMAYILSTDEEINNVKKIRQKDIACVFGVSQSTIAKAIKEAKLIIMAKKSEDKLNHMKEKVLCLDEIKQLGLYKLAQCRGPYARRL